MPVIDILDVPNLALKEKTIAGLDLGTKTIGIAISDLCWSFAHPRPVLKRKKFSIDAPLLNQRLFKENVGVIVIGLPINMNGSNGPRVQATRTFVSNMNSITNIPFVFWDERLSTVAAERSLLEMNVSRAKRSEKIDSAAAAFILQGALDRLKTLKFHI
ncbi:Holliday junction resolvase RuvX [Bartonella tamiae]|uniref:Putative pre-16S rRNA nuclease n=1 Tax=Bartonella tamiae Th239 TaxID=1094558 RepID=J0QZS7_9HYPH|nr:Holliday junction resolvase RuvX [Bartonella tamiae]EJF88759.1 RNAse H-fold protein YqgF [Bartonella tamiae Th239]EJF94991.1 RNAse H-fold protein YqgF [Bartonella tamiae Th307]